MYIIYTQFNTVVFLHENNFEEALDGFIIKVDVILLIIAQHEINIS